ncbi:MAG: ParB/RepB/Spo0J family partition protein [Sediminibacterium sp. Gen4]|jgi:ParB family transcriptional regulator, chromosome partitioning protein|uniref:ParB/RepB/Spo0J family partition protein n=1 Tax=unclassified Sediminibacterium TaxID=2635961 RepID=UPI0015BF00C5|nr:MULTISPECIES: ParB/RepB/Spo0J family partition protein [unclassified Sediminibacterium]MBW0160027.1 ParB/RepB/Spo0J family partition protein [Sediminibacterium sp.]MBW0165780.1 ParB/RepB/Spo0J family partition protein [Sediminibacterium sp.]NWK64747.1 ParB/RepB/Spo0J family partition protein [Sediminibacterium sp. Gen4]
MTNPKQNKELIGKGLRSLLQNIDADLKTTSGALKTDVVEQVTTINRIALSDIQINPKQPRRDFDEQALNELAESLKIHDIIQPLTVSKLSSNKYQLIAGERRFRAAKIAGLKDVPVYIRQANDQQLLELALLENLQRENLNAVEIALSYKRMMDELNYTQEQVAERMGKERSTVTNYIRLLKLPPDIQLAVRSGQLSMGHARALINIDTIDKQLFVYKEIQQKGLSVRQTEELVRKMYQAEKADTVKIAAKTDLPPAYKKIEDNLASHFATKVKMVHNKKGYGSITIEYFSLEELNKILEAMNVTVS